MIARAASGFVRACLIAAVASLLAFALLDLAGPDPAYAELGRHADRESLAQRRVELGLDRPLIVRWVEFVGDIADGRLGRVRASGEPIGEAIVRRVPVSLLAIGPGYVLGHLIGLVWAQWAITRRRRLARQGSDLLAGLGMAIPLVSVIFAVHALASLPASPLASHGWSHATPLEWMRHALAPTLALALSASGFHFAFYLRLLDAARAADHVQAARARGLSSTTLFAYALRPITTLILQRLLLGLPVIALGGSLLIEGYFAIPGIGRLFADALLNGDERVIMALAALAALAFALAQWLLDLLAPLIDPRLRRVPT